MYRGQRVCTEGGGSSRGRPDAPSDAAGTGMQADAIAVGGDRKAPLVKKVRRVGQTH